MKYTEITESQVIDFSQRKQQKQEMQHNSINKEIQIVTRSLDRVLQKAVDKLISKGMEENKAKNVIIRHLSDVVMSHDLDNGFDL